MRWFIVLMAIALNACHEVVAPPERNLEIAPKNGVWVTVLGTVQDAGYPHINCKKTCCAEITHSVSEKKVASLGVLDFNHEKAYLIDATPDITSQLKYLKSEMSSRENEIPDAVFLTHAHIGHYTGLMYFGREALGGDSIPVYAMPRMKGFLETNGPWSQLVELNNIDLQPMAADSAIYLSEKLVITPFLVPHRDEYSETVGFKIQGPNKSLIYIPDIDKWSKWEVNIVALSREVDFLLLDGTFYSEEELNHRDPSEIPHPLVTETMKFFLDAGLRKVDLHKIHFIHLNHTNPLLDTDHPIYEEVVDKGFRIADFGDQFAL